MAEAAPTAAPDASAPVPPVRVARWGVDDPFHGASLDREIAGLDGLTGAEDLLLVHAATARSHARALRRLARRDDAPAVVVAGRGRRRARSVGDLALVRRPGPEGVSAGELGLPPAVDPRRERPVGWRRWANHPVAAVLGTVPDAAALGPLLDPRLDVRLLLTGGVSLGDLPPGLAERGTVRVDGPEELADRLQRFRVLVDDPRWHAGRLDEQQLHLRALAVGTPVVTAGSVPAALDLPGTVSADEVVDRARELVDDDAARERVSVVGRRRVLHAHTGAHRLRSVLAALGWPPPPPTRISVVLATNRPGQLAHAAASVGRQRHPDVELVAVLHGDGFDDLGPLERLPGPVEVVRAPAERVLGECLNLGIERSSGALIAKMDDDDHYGRDHLGDLALALGYSGAALVGRRIEHIHLADRDVTVTRAQSNVERFRDHVSGPTLLAGARTLRSYEFLPVSTREDSTLLERLAADGQPVYGTHALDVVLERRGTGHTWEADAEAMLADAVAVTDGLDLTRTASEPGAYGPA